MAANVLVVANLTANSQHLLDALKARAERSPIRSSDSSYSPTPASRWRSSGCRCS